MQTGEHAEQQRGAVPDGEQRHVQRDFFQSIQEEDDAGEKQQMIVAGDHVLRAEIDERHDLRARAVADEVLVALGNCVRKHDASHQQQRQGEQSEVASGVHRGSGIIAIST